jgi:hypothetical protein
LPLDPVVPLDAGQTISWTCTWQYNGWNTITPGADASTSEMCIAYARVYARNTKEGAQFGCNNVF